MKFKKRYFTVTLILLFSILLSSCSFVSYIKYADTTAPEASFEETLDLYLTKLHEDNRMEKRRISVTVK